MKYINQQHYIDSLEDKCKFCKQPECDDTVAPYWQYDVATEQGITKAKQRCHKACKQQGYANEAYECQKIDADCNDCAFFKREKNLGNSVFGGQCLKFNIATKAYPNKCTGKECFIHRKDA